MDTMTREAPRLHVDLVMRPEDYSQLEREKGSLEVAQSFVIDAPDMAEAANSELQQVKARIKRIETLRASFILPAKQIIAQAEALFNPALDALKGAESFLKAGLIAYNTEQERIAAEERRKREDEERKARQDAERQAAAARAKADEQAREQRRQAEEAEAARVKALAEGNAKAAAAAAAASAAASEKAAAIQENAEAKATELVLAAAASAAPAPPPPPKLSGFSTRDNYKAELKPDATDEKAVLGLVAAIAGVEKLVGRTELAAFLMLNWPSLDKSAKAFKTAMNVPCIVAVNRPVAASRSK